MMPRTAGAFSGTESHSSFVLQDILIYKTCSFCGPCRQASRSPDEMMYSVCCVAIERGRTHGRIGLMKYQAAGSERSGQRLSGYQVRAVGWCG